MPNVLYITYDGIMEPLGQSQVFQYLRLLAKDHRITLISYEKKSDWEKKNKREEMKKEVKSAGIRWIPLRYHKSPTALATSFDILQGIFFALFLTVFYRIQIVHARSYVSSVIALTVKKIFRRKFIFDMRGFWPDEKVDGGAWSKNSRIYKITKWFEKKFFLNSDVVVSLTENGVRTIKEFEYLRDRMPSFEVIPTCTNLGLFKPVSNLIRNKDYDKSLTIGYVGTTVNWYLFDPVLTCFNIILETYPNAKLIIVNREEHQFISDRLIAFKIPDDKVEIKAGEYRDIPQYMSQMDVTIFFIKPVYSKKGSAPTKLGEFLGCGIPCLTNSGVGDLEGIIAADNVGVIVNGFSLEELRVGVKKFLKLLKDPELKERCIQSARSHFSLEDGVKNYDRIYSNLGREAK